MEPSIQLTRPYNDPPNTFRATSVQQMYDVATSGLVASSYDIGIAATWQCVLSIRNKTVTNALQVSVTLPSYLTSNQSTSFVVGADSIFNITLLVNEPTARLLGKSRTKFYQEQLGLHIRPLGITGPVCVKTINSPLVSG
jgi:hypothetical protein